MLLSLVIIVDDKGIKGAGIGEGSRVAFEDSRVASEDTRVASKDNRVVEAGAGMDGTGSEAGPACKDGAAKLGPPGLSLLFMLLSLVIIVDGKGIKGPSIGEGSRTASEDNTVASNDTRVVEAGAGMDWNGSEAGPVCKDGAAKLGRPSLSRSIPSPSSL